VRRLRLPFRRDATGKLAGGSRCGSMPARPRRRKPWRGRNPRRASGTPLASPPADAQRTRTGEQGLEAESTATGSEDRSTRDWPVPRAARRAAECRDQRQEGRGNVERRSGSGRGKSSVGEGTPRALRHETRPGRLTEEEAVERVRNPEDGTDRVRQTRARRGDATQWTRTAGQCWRSRNLTRGAAHACQMRGRRRRSYSVAGATPWMGCTGT
jgi:hypothetical protein